MITGIIVDDEIPSIELNKRVLEASGDIRIIASSHKPKEALRLIEQLKPDVAFIDIQMPNMSGFQLAHRIQVLSIHTQIVFVTAHEKHAREAFDIEAMDYLLKPLALDHTKRIVKRIKKIKEKINYLDETESHGGIFILGAMKVSSQDLDEQTFRWRTNKTAELMAYFLINLGEEVTKDKIIESLWPDSDILQASTHLHTTIYKLKDTLKKAKIPAELIYREGSYYFKLHDIYIDLVEFELLMKSKEEVQSRNLSWFEEKLALYKGHLFGDKDYPWSTTARETYLLNFITHTTRVASYYLKQHEFQAAKRHLLKILQVSPYEEETHWKILNIYYQTDDRVTFLKHYQQLVKLFEAELGILPSKAIKQLYDQFQNENKSNNHK